MFLAIIAAQNGRITKFQEYDTLVGAMAHVMRVRATYPDAFTAPMPTGIGVRDLLVNLQAQTVVISLFVEPDSVILAKLHNVAVEAELAKEHQRLIDTGATAEAVAYRQEKQRQGF